MADLTAQRRVLRRKSLDVLSVSSGSSFQDNKIKFWRHFVLLRLRWVHQRATKDFANFSQSKSIEKFPFNPIDPNPLVTFCVIPFNRPIDKTLIQFPFLRINKLNACGAYCWVDNNWRVTSYHTIYPNEQLALKLALIPFNSAVFSACTCICLGEVWAASESDTSN